MSHQRVKINSASPEEIATLYDIGWRGAQRIVAYRETYGPFRSPDELARVEGISFRLATTLAPHIDWQVPLEPEQPKKRDWLSALFWLTILLTVVLVMFVIVLSLFEPATRANVMTGPSAWIKTTITISGLVILICFSVYSATRMGANLTGSREGVRKLSRTGLMSMVIALSSGIVLILGVVIYFQIYSSGDWTVPQTSGNSWSLIVGLVSFIFLYLFMVPQIVVWRRPELITHPWVAGLFDMAVGLFGLMLILGLRVYQDLLPLWLLLLCGAAGGIVVIIAFISLRRGESFFHASLDFLDPRVIDRQQATVNDWRTWLNSRLPDPQQQQELKASLGEIYRPSPAQTLIRVLVFGIGGWIVLTVISAIIELYVQDWWRSLFG